MHKFATSLFLVTLLMVPAAAALAQERVTVAGVEAVRVVIAPPQTELARIIKSGLAANYQAAGRGVRAHEQSRQLYFFYGARHFEPLWLTEDADGEVTFSSKAQRIIEVFEAAELEGFRPSDYLTDAFSAAVVRYAQDAYGGRVSPRDVYSTWTLQPKRIDEATLLVQLAESDAPQDILLDLSPKHREFVQLKAALAKFYDGSVIDAAVTIPEGLMLRSGMQDERVPLLRQRLDVPEPEIPETAGAEAEANIIYDEALVEAVKAFQESLGLTVDGITGPATVAALNGGSATTKEDIVANMERWRWAPDELGDFHVAVNIPEFRLTVMNKGQPHYTTRVVVGTARHQTPVFSDEIEHIVVNPYWNVPASIATNEIAPRLVSNPWYLDGQNMELLYGGKLVNAAAVDWTTTSIRNFRIRQRPGTGNALGRIKFLFPNQHDVYLHDTPSKSLFQRSFRAYSHGCIRVHNPMEFADALLAFEPQLTAASLEGMFGSKERWVNLEAHIPVHISYYTLRVDEDGTIRSYGDVYGHNQRLIEMLEL
jgi:murein L,D-transpeptidase YcbB/YkuD